MITLTHHGADPSEPVAPGQTVSIPHQWAHLAPHEVRILAVWADKTGQQRYWASGTLASNGETVMVIVPHAYPTTRSM